MSPRSDFPFLLHVLFTTERVADRSWWIAQCLEFDIAAQGDTLAEVQLEFQRVLAARVLSAKDLGVDPFEGVPQAPAPFWHRYVEGEPHPVKRMVTEIGAEMLGKRIDWDARIVA